MRVERGTEAWILDGRWYRLTLPLHSPVAWLDDQDGGGRWAELRLLASIDALEGPDETLDVGRPELEEADGRARLTWRLESSRWSAKRLVVVADDDAVTVHAEVEGSGRPTDVRLLGGRAVLPRSGGGMLWSGAWFETVLCPSPTDPARIVKPSSESAVIGVVSGSEPGRGNWFFTPGPFCYAVSRTPAATPSRLPEGPWLTFGLAVRPGEANFGGFAYRAVDRGFAFVLDYDGRTRVDGVMRTPAVRVSRGGAGNDPYAAIAAHGRWLAANGHAPAAPAGPAGRPAWWRQPIFCGWGEQCRAAVLAGRGFSGAADHATEAFYDRTLDHLEARGVVPGTIVIDDKWQAAYGTNVPDEAKWPDLRHWIRRRHDRDQRVLLWWKAWDPEGLPADWCVRSSTGAVLGMDPTHPRASEALRASVRSMLATDGLDADGLKIDFTARTPSGAATVHHGEAWGVELLRLLLDTVHEEAKRVKPDALLVGHTPNPLVAGAVDMIRLNDTLRLDDPRPRVDVVPQMQYRAAVVRAACPEHLIDTDDWCAPDLATWRRYLAAKPALGVPALYYATGLDLSGEAFEEADYRAIGETWAAWRAAESLDEPGRPAPSSTR